MIPRDESVELRRKGRELILGGNKWRVTNAEQPSSVWPSVSECVMLPHSTKQKVGGVPKDWSKWIFLALKQVKVMSLLACHTQKGLYRPSRKQTKMEVVYRGSFNMVKIISKRKKGQHLHIKWGLKEAPKLSSTWYTWCEIRWEKLLYNWQIFMESLG